MFRWDSFDGDEDPLPDLQRLTDQALKALIDELAAREQAIESVLYLVKGKLEILREERVGRFWQPPKHVDAGQVATALLRKWLPDGFSGLVPLTVRLDDLRALVENARRRAEGAASDLFHGYAAGLADALAVLEDI